MISGRICEGDSETPEGKIKRLDCICGSVADEVISSYSPFRATHGRRRDAENRSAARRCVTQTFMQYLFYYFLTARQRMQNKANSMSAEASRRAVLRWASATRIQTGVSTRRHVTWLLATYAIGAYPSSRRALILFTNCTATFRNKTSCAWDVSRCDVIVVVPADPVYNERRGLGARRTARTRKA